MTVPLSQPAVRATMPFIVPALAAVTAGMRFQVGPGITPAILAGIVLLPVWWPALAPFRLVRPLLLIGLGAVVSGALLTLADTSRLGETERILRESLPVLAMIASIGLLIWARECIGAAWTVAAFAVGGFAHFAITGGNPVNLWKYTLSIPVALLLLGLTMRLGRWWEVLALAVVGGISAVSDSRSSLAIMLIAAALVVVQIASRRARRARPWLVLLGLVLLGLAMAAAVQSLLLDGALGEAAAERTQAQSAESGGSFVLGGRPEMGASVQLVTRQPWGYGSGTTPSFEDVMAAKTGMAALGYDPNNGYVNRFMFGDGFEVHSVLGDFWVRFGLFGAAFALGVLALAVYSVAARISLRTASGALAMLTVLGVWDTFFSPLLTSYNTLALMLALAVLATGRDDRPQRAPRAREPRATDRVLQRRRPPRAGDA